MKNDKVESLRVYKLAEQLADAVWEVVSNWDQFARDTVGKQIVRSADSVGANLGEGVGRWSYRDNRRFVRTARGSLYETRYWLRQAHKRNLIPAESEERIRMIFRELPPRLNNYIHSLDRAISTSPPSRPLSTSSK